MRKILFLLLAGVVSLSLAACNDTSAPKIGVLDMNVLLRDSVPGKAGLKYIEGQQASLQGRMEEIQGRLEKNPKDEAAQRELQKLFMEAQQQVQGDGQAVVGVMLEAFQKAADKFRKDHGYLAIVRVEALDSYDPQLDVTSAMMQEVNKLNLDFKSLLAAQRNSPMVMELMENGEAAGAEKAENPDQAEQPSKAEPKKEPEQKKPDDKQKK